MSPTDKLLDKLLDKLAKMRASAEGEARLGNAAAAEAFAEAINRLLVAHELSAADIPLGGVVADEPIVEQRVDLRVHGVREKRVRIGWQEALARIVAEAHLCKFLVTPGTNHITLVGTRQHVVVAEYAYGTLVAAADRMSLQARRAWWRANRHEPPAVWQEFRASWLQGFVERIAERLREARLAEIKASDLSTSTALVRLDKALARAKDYVDEKYKRTHTSARMASGCRAGRVEGRAAADRITLGQRAVGSGSGRKLID